MAQHTTLTGPHSCFLQSQTKTSKQNLIQIDLIFEVWVAQQTIWISGADPGETSATYQLDDHAFHELPEGHLLVVPVVVDVLDELGDDLGVRVRLKAKALGLQEGLNVLVVGDDAVVDDKKL